MKRVSSASISDITEAGPRSGLPDVPDIDALSSEFNLKSKHARKLSEAIEKLPDGMDLVPVMYTKIPSEQNRDIMDEFAGGVERDFYRYLARHHSEDLRQAGFCDHAIEQMGRGRPPANESGQLYNYDVDHVIERAGSGQLGLEKEKDPDLEGDILTYPVNHMANFFFLPREVHEIKNEINKYQLMNIEDGESRIIWMAVPNPDHHPLPFYSRDDQYGPSIEHGNAASASYVAMTASTHVAELSRRSFNRTGQEDFFARDFAKSELAPERLDQLNEAMEYAARRWESVLEILQDTQPDRHARKQISHNMQYLDELMETYHDVNAYKNGDILSRLEKVSDNLRSALGLTSEPSVPLVNRQAEQTGLH